MYGLIAEFDNPEALVGAAHRAFAEGFRKMDAYSPFPVEGLAEALVRLLEERFLRLSEELVADFGELRRPAKRHRPCRHDARRRTGFR